MGVIIFNGRSSKEYGIEVETPPDYGVPEPEMETIHVPGRNGDIVIDKGSYKNVPGRYEISSGDGETGHTILARAITEWLRSAKNYARLEDSYDPDIFRMAVYKESNEIENIYGLGAKAEVVFDCKPQRYLKSGENVIKGTGNGSNDWSMVIINPTNYDSEPAIKFSSFGPSVISFNGTTQVNIKGIDIEYLPPDPSTAYTMGDLKLDVDKFIDQYYGSLSEVFFITEACSHVITLYDGTTGVTSAYWLTDGEATFIDAVNEDSEAIYAAIFQQATSIIYDMVSDTLDYTILEDPSYFSEYSQGRYELLYDGVDYYNKTVSNPNLTVTMNASDYLARFQNDPHQAYVAHTYTYDAVNETWIDEAGYAILFSDYGISVEGLPNDKDTITCYLFPRWTKNWSGASGYVTTKIFAFDGYPTSGDMITVEKTKTKWSLYKEKQILNDDATLSDYGIGFTGTPNDEDTIVITATCIWKYEDTGDVISLSDYGISYTGYAKFYDQILVHLGRPAILDTYLKDCYTESGESQNANIELPNGYPILKPGRNVISFGSRISNVEVTPRWWTL